jgi:hypothetical protein
MTKEEKPEWWPQLWESRHSQRVRESENKKVTVLFPGLVYLMFIRLLLIHRNRMYRLLRSRVPESVQLWEPLSVRRLEP